MTCPGPQAAPSSLMFPTSGGLCRASGCHADTWTQSYAGTHDSLAEETITDLSPDPGDARLHTWFQDRRHVLDCGRSADFNAYIDRKSAGSSRGESLISFGLDMNSPSRQDRPKGEKGRDRSENCCSS